MELPYMDNFFRYITERFSHNSAILLKSWLDYRRKLCTSRQQLTFLVQCRKWDLVPTHIMKIKINLSFHSNYISRKFNELLKTNQLKLLNLEIEDLNIHLNYLDKKIKNIEDSLFNCLPREIVNRFFELNNHKITSVDFRIKKKLIKKFNNLKEKYNICESPFSNIDKTKWLINISDKCIPDAVSDLLSLGDNFALPIQQQQKNDRFNYVLDVVKSVEISLNNVSTDLAKTTRISVANSLQKFLDMKKHVKLLDRQILGAFKASKIFLKENDDLLVTRADKGQTTVIMNRNDYYKKMDTLLSDQSTYRVLKKDPIKNLSSKINSLIKSWRSNELIDEKTFKYLNCTNGNLPRCYGLPKIHKDNYPLRIIVSSIGSPVYNLASYIHDILHKSIKKPNSFIKDGWSFATNIKDTIINKDETMISLDVSSLFSNIPKELVLQAIKNRWNDICLTTQFSLEQFLYVIELILDSTSFSFNGKFYEQIFGSPMGSPLSPILADMVMDDLETSCLKQLSFAVPIYYRYVDDVFTIVPHKKIQEILTTFNKYHERLKFTFEMETNCSISFLNTSVIRADNRLITNWYRKPTWSGRYINFHSNHPLQYKINTIYNLVDHALLLSNDNFHTDNIKIVHNTLLNNNFPEAIIKKHMQKRINFLKHCYRTSDSGAMDKKSFICLPYINETCQDLKYLMRNINDSVVYKVTKKLNTLIKRGKDKQNNNDKTNVVYRLNCKDCNATYIGQTKRHLRTRIKEHCNNIRLHETNQSVVSLHRSNYGHDFDWTNPVILHNEKFTKKREIAEMIYIKKHNNTVNSHKDTANLNNVYEKVIKVV